MDILYIVGRGGSKCNDFELQCSLRSIEKYGKNVGKVVISGYCPKWLSDNVIKVPCEDIYSNTNDHGNRNANVLNKLLKAIDYVGDEFLVSFDDNFYVKETDFNNYPHYVRKMEQGIYLPKHTNNESKYMKCLANTRENLEKLGLPILNFAVHRNLHCTKRSIFANMETLQWIIDNSIQCDRFCLLNNWEYKNYPFDVVEVVDVKIKNGGDWWKTDPKETEVFSTGDFTKDDGLYILLSSLYPNKSKYELWPH